MEQAPASSSRSRASGSTTSSRARASPCCSCTAGRPPPISTATCSARSPRPATAPSRSTCPASARSDKPLDASYSFRFHDRALTGFLDALGIERDRPRRPRPRRAGRPLLGEPAPRARHAASRCSTRSSTRGPPGRWSPSSPRPDARASAPGSPAPPGLRFAMRLGVHDKDRLTRGGDRRLPGALPSRAGPQGAAEGRRPGSIPKGFKEIERWLAEVEVPVRIVYGERDRILPDVARTMRKVAATCREAEVTDARRLRPLPAGGAAGRHRRDARGVLPRLAGAGAT